MLEIATTTKFVRSTLDRNHCLAGSTLRRAIFTDTLTDRPTVQQTSWLTLLHHFIVIPCCAHSHIALRHLFVGNSGFFNSWNCCWLVRLARHSFADTAATEHTQSCWLFAWRPELANWLCWRLWLTAVLLLLIADDEYNDCWLVRLPLPQLAVAVVVVAAGVREASDFCDRNSKCVCELAWQLASQPASQPTNKQAKRNELVGNVSSGWLAMYS